MPEKTVTLKISSPLCDEEIEVPEELWGRFEEKAKDLGVAVEELFVIALDAYIKEVRDGSGKSRSHH